MPNSAIYLVLSSELIGADAAVIGVVFVVQPLSFLLTWDVILGVCDTSFMTLQRGCLISAGLYSMLHDLLLHEFCVAWLGLICFEDLCCPGSFRILVQRIDFVLTTGAWFVACYWDPVHVKHLPD